MIWREPACGNCQEQNCTVHHDPALIMPTLNNLHLPTQLRHLSFSSCSCSRACLARLLGKAVYCSVVVHGSVFRECLLPRSICRRGRIFDFLLLYAPPLFRGAF